MKKFLAVCCLMAVTGCDFSTPLVKNPDLPIDPALTGLWRTTGTDGQTADLLVLRLNKNEYLVAYPAGTESTLFARGALWRNGEARLLQLDWFGTALGTVPENAQTFQYARFALEGDTLKAELVEPTEELKKISEPADLARALVEKWTTPGLFRETQVFTRIRPGSPTPSGGKGPEVDPIRENPPKTVPEA